MPLSRREILFGSLAAVAFRNDTLDFVSNAVAKYGSLDDAQDEDFGCRFSRRFRLIAT
jgi:hypothetical protein